MKRGLRPLLTIVIVYALATALQMGAGYTTAYWRLSRHSFFYCFKGMSKFAEQ